MVGWTASPSMREPQVQRRKSGGSLVWLRTVRASTRTRAARPLHLEVRFYGQVYSPVYDVSSLHLS